MVVSVRSLILGFLDVYLERGNVFGNNPEGEDGPASREEVLAYIGDICGELAGMAKKPGLASLSVLLSQVVVVARDLRGDGQDRRPQN